MSSSYVRPEDRIDTKEKLLIMFALFLGVCIGLFVGFNWGVYVGAGLP